MSCKWSSEDRNGRGWAKELELWGRGSTGYSSYLYSKTQGTNWTRGSSKCSMERNAISPSFGFELPIAARPISRVMRDQARSTWLMAGHKRWSKYGRCCSIPNLVTRLSLLVGARAESWSWLRTWVSCGFRVCGGLQRFTNFSESSEAWLGV